MADYCDSPEFKNNALFIQDNGALQLMLYYDEVELCNPLGSSRNKHKLGKPYWPPYFRIALDSIRSLLFYPGQFNT